MKFTAAVAVALSGIAATSAHMIMADPRPRGGYGTMSTHQFKANIQSFINYYDKEKRFTVKFPCGGYDPRSPSVKMTAGQVIKVQFANTDQFDELKKNKHKDLPVMGSREGKPKNKPDDDPKNPRHGGGECEFHLSYDGGKTLNTIGRYTKSCPSIYEHWPVKIPDNVKECKQKGKCLFVWTWLAHTLPQWYMNCADIELTNSKGNQRKPPAMSSDRLKKLSSKNLKLTAPGEKKYKSKKGRDLYEDTAPIPQEVKDNRNGVIPKSSIKI